ncbi:ABC transporter substrate-binding protein [Microbacterium tumbae]
MVYTATMRHPVRTSALLAVVAIGVGSLVGCSNGGDAEGGGGDLGTFDYLAANENAIIRDELATLGASGGACEAAEEAMPLKVETLPQGDVTQRVTLLASQDALPEMFIAPTAPLRPGGALGDDETVVNLEEKLTELGVIDDVLPAAIAAVKNQYGDRFVSLPYQFNIEGIFYNKQMFADLGLEEPKTWDEFLDASDAIQESGKQPFVVAGSQAWTILRWVGNYIFRDLGPDAMQKVADGEAKLTDPEYVEAIAAVADLGKYLGPGVATMDIQTATSQLLTGEAGMMYNGSFMLADINNEELNPLGPDAFGFMPFPAVEGGKGDINQYPANAGAATSISTKLDNEGVDAWLTCIAENFGSSVMNNQGTISGFALNQDVQDVPPLTAEIQEIMTGVDETVLWFEGPLGQRGVQAAGEGAVPLITGSQTPEQFAEIIQAAVDEDLAGS